MGGFNPPVPQQDSNWEIRAAVLLSLFFQVLLIFLGPTRKRSSRPLFRLTVWACYLLADWVADLALGLLLNNMGNTGGNNDSNAAAGSSSSPVIFAFWTPFLLLHLGGPDTITAYSVEDNELWNRHLIGLLFELFSASVIIFCSLRGNPLVPATMLMLVAGVIKYGERTYSLYAGSAESLRDSILGPPEPGPNYSRLITEFDSKKKAGLVVEIYITNGEAEQAHEEMEKQERMRLVLDVTKSMEARAYEFFLIFRRLLVDVIIGFKERRLSQEFFLERHDMTSKEAFEVLAVELNFMYDMVYTKAPVAHSKAGWLLRCICSACLLSTLAVFFFLDKPRHQIQHVDVGITYALLLGGLALDAAALLMLFFSNRAQLYLESSRRLRWLARLRKMIKRWRTLRWSETVSQMNLIRYCREKPGRPYSSSSNKGGKWWLMIVKMLGIEEIVDDFFFIRRVSLINKDGGGNKKDSPPLLDFIFQGLKPAAEELKVKGKAGIMEMCNCRGKKVIKRHEEEIKDAIRKDEEVELVATDLIKKVLEKKDEAEMKSEAERLGLAMDDININNPTDISKIKAKIVQHKFELILNSVLESDFDESLLLWHIATDLCRLRDKKTAPTADEERLRPIGETLSEYMLYLLIKRPEMLAATAGVGLRPFRDTCAEARRFFASKEAWLGIDQEHGMRRFLLSVNTTEISPASVKGDRSKSVLFDAVILAKELRKLDEELMWEVIAGVWGEILTYAAGKCRGSMHVRQLSRGGELITFVWLLMQHMGLSDMYQIQQGDPTVQLIVHY